ncbi:guanylate cyclase [Mycolicibacter kumamotonensis]|uniref:Guanylate cyclase n=1 Tax=Mycolicibacter kumamotonensis TaxID=354243 RepID=A0A1B8SDZ8_9MYCO|nr:guanylate cyclase [Mycolicibacter kumamotonensis]
MPEKTGPHRRRSFSLDEAAAWLNRTTNDVRVVDLVRRVRRALPGDPEFGDPLSTAGDGGPQAAARAADRLMGDRSAASREVSLGALQIWQALTERMSRAPANAESTLVFTDLVGFSTWSLRSGDDATLTLLRRVSQAVEPPLLDAGGRIVKRMGDGIMAVFRDPLVAVSAVLEADEAIGGVEVNGFTPRMRTGVHTGRPQRLADDWLGVDVNIAARVMERAVKGGIVVSGATLERIDPADLDELGVTAKRVRRQVLSAKTSGVPADLMMYRLKAVHREPPAAK